MDCSYIFSVYGLKELNFKNGTSLIASLRRAGARQDRFKQYGDHTFRAKKKGTLSILGGRVVGWTGKCITNLDQFFQTIQIWIIMISIKYLPIINPKSTVHKRYFLS